jgi:uncharacterized membrane protein YfcA
VLALTLSQAKTIAVLVAVALVIGALASAWLMKTVAQKAVTVVILVLLAALIWSQRSALQECADRVRAEVRAGRTQIDTTCTFVGWDVPISTSRS